MSESCSPDGSAQRSGASTTPTHPTTLRFPREHRLRRRADFLHVQSEGSRVTTRHFVFLLAPRVPAGSSRLGITVTKKVGSAVVRNRAKRLVREAYRHLPGLLPDGIDMVVIVRAALSERKASDVIQEWQSVQRVLRRRAQSVLASLHEGEGDA